MEHPELLRAYRSRRSNKKFLWAFLITLVIVIIMGITARAEETESESEVKIISPYEDIDIQTDMDELLSIVAMESQTESYGGQMAVVEVIYNRVLNDGFANSIHGVLSERSGGHLQFTTWLYIRKPYNTPTKEQRDAIMEVWQGGSGLQPYLYEAQMKGQIPWEVQTTDYVWFGRGKRKEMHNPIKIGHHWFGTR